MLSVSDILFTLLGFGFAVGCTIRVGQLLGSQRPAQAKLAGKKHVIAMYIGNFKDHACVIACAAALPRIYTPVQDLHIPAQI